YRHSAARNENKEQSHRESLGATECHVCRAVDNVVDEDGQLISVKRKPPSKPVCKYSAQQQAQAGAAPDDANPGSSSIKNDFTKQSEKNLRRAPAHGPTHGEQRNRQHKRYRSHVA